MRLSVVIPIYNEEGNLRELHRQIGSALSDASFDYEVIAVNDGSTDGSEQILKELTSQDKSFKVINFSRNFGQTAAISAGIDLSTGEVILPMDGDLQNDPADITHFLNKIDQGFDVVSGWRKKRKDKLVTRKIPSWLANKLISLITGLKIHDYGCTMKAYRRETIKDIRFYGEMHRFMPAYTYWHGAKVGEIVVNHRFRTQGKTKYGISRTLRVILDLLTVKFLTKYSTRPMHFFGYIGYWMVFFGFLSGLFALYLKFFRGTSFISTPLPLLTVFLGLVGLQFIVMGLLAEILIRIYYETGSRATYSVREKINFK